MSSKRKAILIPLLLFAAVNYVSAQRTVIAVSTALPAWQKIGEVKTGFMKESESIQVMGKDEVRSIKIRVKDGPIDVKRVIVFYVSGDTQEIPLRGLLRAGTETLAFKLKHPTAELKKITFMCSNEPNFKEEKAHLELYGLR